MSRNTWIHRIVRPGVRPLLGTGVTPNHLTTLRLVTGVAAAVALALGTPEGRAWGGALLLVSILLDRADGELARLGGQSGAWGHKYDLISDASCNFLVFLGIGVGLRGHSFGLWAVVMGLIAGIAITIILLLALRMEALKGQGAADFKGAAGFDPDDAMLIVPLVIWLGWSEALIAAACVGAPVFALYAYLRLRRRLRNNRI